MNLREYARAVAEAVNREWEGRDPSDETRDWLDGIVASVPAPTNSVSTGSKLVGTPDIDPEEVRRGLESDFVRYESERRAIDAAAREWLRLLYEQNEDLCFLDAVRQENERLKADLDAAVARERDRVIGIFVGELQKLHEKTVLDCGDNSCLFATRRGGMRTNGGCRCIERLLDAAVAREREAAVYDFAAWLTTRKERLVLSSSDDAAPAAKAVQAYLRARSAKGSE
jgi:hypothetical protein